MARPPRTRLTLLLAGGSLTLLFALLALLLYLQTEARVVERHSKDQRLLADSAAMALEQRVGNYGHIAEQLAAPLKGMREARWNQALNNFPTVAPGSNVLLLRPNGTLRFRQPPRAPAALEAAVLPLLGARESVLTNPFPPAATDREVVLLVPLLAEGRVVAQVGFIFPFAHLVESLFPRATAKMGMSVSLLDEQGNVLANTRHLEMTGRRIPAPGESCLPCHTSFALERRMLAGETGVGRLQVGREPLALVAFTPVNLPGRRWSLALCEPYSAITADTRQGFRAITLLLGLSLLVWIVATAVILQYRLQRRRAEERAQLAERRAALECQLRQSEQLAALGRMTSQIAHQINTPLAALGLNVAYLRGELTRHRGEASPDIEEVSQAIVAEIDRLKRVVNDYLRFSRLPQPVLAGESLRELVGSFLDFIEPEARQRGVRVEADLGADPATVRLDADLFRDAFLNLIRNSFEAMPQGGTLRVHLRREAAEVVLSIEDTGRGIPPDLLPRIFEPFFTTKKDGTGLGLAYTRHVLEEQGGTIECRSTPGQGTTFVVALPAATAEGVAAEEFSLLQKER